LSIDSGFPLRVFGLCRALFWFMLTHNSMLDKVTLTADVAIA
jgi:hypothetical protein